jgi:hypothetical protein
MKEDIFENDEDANFVRRYLRLMRDVRPTEMLVDDTAVSLSEMQQSGSSDIDFELFAKLTSSARKDIKSDYSSEFELIPLDRFFVAQPPVLEWGGFHSSKAVGYQNIFRAGCTVVLNKSVFESKIIRTVELVRSYLHDSMHHSTYCSFRALRRNPATPLEAKRLVPEVYRYQYGINYRNSKGVSFSSMKLTHRVPYAINLNLLMDGVGIEIVADILNRLSVSKLISDPSKQDRLVMKDILLSVERNNPSEWGADFYFSVILPVKKFVEHWGGEFFSRLVLSSMFSGDLTEIKSYFDDQLGQEGSWDRVFRSPSYSED